MQKNNGKQSIRSSFVTEHVQLLFGSFSEFDLCASIVVFVIRMYADKPLE